MFEANKEVLVTRVLGLHYEENCYGYPLTNAAELKFSNLSS